MPRTDRRLVERLLTHQVVEVVDRAHLRQRLLAGEKLRVKLGVDPTAPDIHLGFAVVLWKLREFQDAGHTAVLIIGDATAAIGDPSGRKKTRPPLSPRAIAAHGRTYLAQVGKILNLKKVEVRHNREWLSPLRFSDLVRLASLVTVARVLEREDFAFRLKTGAEIHLHELLYPLAQAYDSVAVRADLELGGTDQLWNLLAGRELQRKLGLPPQDVLTVPLLVGLDGKEKMSKSLGNAVGITESPEDMIGKLMTVPDLVTADFARYAADWAAADLAVLPRRLRRENPRDVKLAVARSVVERYHGPDAAQRAAAEWVRVFREGQLPRRIPRRRLRAGAWDVAEILVAAGLASSRSEARRLVAQGGVQHNSQPVRRGREQLLIQKGDLLQVGKRKFLKVA